ncbi:MAG: hypothetical protein ACSHYF_03205 [Verrucomicrobiaceae bacterium]
MKKESIFSWMSLFLTSGSLLGVEFETSKPVGFETISYGAGFTAIGLRYHEAVVSGGVTTSSTASSISVAGVDFSALLDSQKEYVLEIETAEGAIQVVNSWSGSTIVTPSDVSGLITAGTTTYSLRPVSTLASVFGATSAEVTLAKGGGGSGGTDQVWISDGAGGYLKYYFDEYAPPNYNVQAWVEIGSGIVDPATVNLVYADGFLINSQAGGGTIPVGGSLKLMPTELRLLNGYTFVSSMVPGLATLETAFPDGGNLMGGGGQPNGAHQIWIPNGAASYEKYYFDYFAPPGYGSPSWVYLEPDGSLTAVDGATVTLPSGYVISAPSAGNVTQGVPSFFSSL